MPEQSFHAPSWRTAERPSVRPFPPYSQPHRSNESLYIKAKGLSQLSTHETETTVEKIWGDLFDEECHPTSRLSRILRGLATYIVFSLVYSSPRVAKRMLINYYRSKNTNLDLAS